MGAITLQREEALGRANDVRSSRRELREGLAAGEQDIFEVLLSPPWFVGEMPIHELMVWGHKIGRVRVSNACWEARVWPLHPVKRVTFRQRVELVSELRKPGTLKKLRARPSVYAGRGE